MDNIKKFEDFLDRMQGLLDSAKKQGHIIVRVEDLENTFPELKESEDENIRKWLIEMVEELRKANPTNADHNGNCSDAIAWLEKQGEPTNINPSEFDLRLNKLLKQFETLPKEELVSSLSFYLNVVQNDGTYREEKQGEQKPIWTDNDRTMAFTLLRDVDQMTYISKEGKNERLQWLNSLEEKFTRKEKPADKVEPKFKVKYAGSEYNVFETKNIAGVPFYGIEDEPNHIDYVQAENCEIINGGYGIKEGGFSIPTKPAMFSEQKPADKVEDEEYNGEDYGIDGLWHAQRILEKTLGKVDGYQTDDGILEHRCAITAVKKLYEHKPAEWSEEDEKIALGIEQVMNCASFLNIVPDKIEKVRTWLKNLRQRTI